jgi:3-mercaptopyruvate sulfurtransferase SseA
MFSTLIDPAALAPHLADEKWAVLDCRFDLSEPDKGEALYLDGHIPGARYVHLDRDLSGEKTGTNGRHPLPTAEQMRERFGALGIGPGTQVVAYDADTGMYAARLWWMLRFMGHNAVAVLDGGLARWMREGHAAAARSCGRQRSLAHHARHGGSTPGRYSPTLQIPSRCSSMHGPSRGFAARVSRLTSGPGTFPAPATSSSSRT